MQSARELFERQIGIEREELLAAPEEEAEELALIYQAKGLDPEQAREFGQRLVQDHDAALDTLAREELGIDPAELGGSAWVAAITSFLLFAVGAIIPVLAYFFVAGTTALIISVVLSVIGLFVIGAAITVITGRSALRSGLRQVLFGVAAADYHVWRRPTLRDHPRWVGPGKEERWTWSQGLRQPEAYPWRPDTVDMVETHISWVFLAGDKVVKSSAPWPMASSTTRARRRVTNRAGRGAAQSAADRRRLSRRRAHRPEAMAATVVGGEGQPIEWATLMRRLPASGMLDALLAAGHAPPDLAARLARRLIPFHRDLAPSCGCTEDVAAAATAIVTRELG